MNQLHPRGAGSARQAGTRSGITRQDPKGSQMTSTSTGLATMPYLELAADPRAGVIAPGDCGHDEAPRSLSQRC